MLIPVLTSLALLSLIYIVLAFASSVLPVKYFLGTILEDIRTKRKLSALNKILIVLTSGFILAISILLALSPVLEKIF